MLNGQVLIDQLNYVLVEAGEALLAKVIENHKVKFGELSESDENLYRAFITDILTEASDEFVTDEIEVEAPAAPMYLRTIKGDETPEYVYVGGELMPINAPGLDDDEDGEGEEDFDGVAASVQTPVGDETQDEMDNTELEKALPVMESTEQAVEEAPEQEPTQLEESKSISKPDEEIIESILAKYGF
jgi:hypothetical protein